MRNIDDTHLDAYMKALKNAENKIEEYQIGEKLGLTEKETKEILKILLERGKIQFQSFGICSYTVIS